MQKENQRAIRRHRRQVSIDHAFDIYWRCWGRGDDPYQDWYPRDTIFLVTEEERRDHQNDHREEVLNQARRVAKHLKNCSCFMCSGHHELSRQERRERTSLADDFDDLQEWKANLLGTGAVSKTVEAEIR